MFPFPLKGAPISFMQTVHKKSLLPLVGIAATWLLWAAFLPMYRTSDFLLLGGVSAAVYFGLSQLFPGKDVQVEEPPESTGDEELDSLLEAGRKAAAEYDALKKELRDPSIRERAARLGELTRKIFEILKENHGLKSQVKRFSDYFLPAPLKLLRTYEELEKQGVRGENIDGTMEKISAILDATIEAYTREIDALFEGQALDIETDIQVLEQMMKREGLTGSDFGAV